jgi:hypothetical protein
MEPKTYDYKNPDEGFDTPKAAPPTPQSKASDIVVYCGNQESTIQA